MSPSSNQNPEKGKNIELARATVKRISIGIFASFALFPFYALSIEKFEATFVLILTGLASLSGGAILGFLFAFPKAAPVEKPELSDSESASVTHSVNANLNEVSDWLTKMIVGLGLVNLAKIDSWLLKAGKEIGGDFDGQIIVAVSIPFFAAAGFLLTYIKTRVDLAPALAEADHRTLGDVINEKVKQVVEDQAAKDLEVRETIQAVLDGSEERSQREIDQEVSSASPTALADIAVRAQAQNQLGLNILKSSDDPGHRHKARRLIQKAIPILKALARENPHYRQNHVELGFALVYVGETGEDFKLAKDHLTEAIRRAGGEKATGGSYQLARAAANLKYLRVAENSTLSEEGRQDIRDLIAQDLESVARNTDEFDEKEIKSFLRGISEELDQDFTALNIVFPPK